MYVCTCVSSSGTAHTCIQPSHVVCKRIQWGVATSAFVNRVLSPATSCPDPEQGLVHGIHHLGDIVKAALGCPRDRVFLIDKFGRLHLVENGVDVITIQTMAGWNYWFQTDDFTANFQILE